MEQVVCVCTFYQTLSLHLITEIKGSMQIKPFLVSKSNL